MASRSYSPFPLNYEGANSFLGSRQSRKVRNNTYVQRRGKYIAVMLHSTDVVEYHPDGSIYICTGGWSTNTTRDRINGYSPVGVSRMQWVDYVNGEPWDGQKLKVA